MNAGAKHTEHNFRIGVELRQLYVVVTIVLGYTNDKL